MKLLLGKPAAADLSLGLATAPVLFAAETFPHLNTLIGIWHIHPHNQQKPPMPELILKNLDILARRFEADGDVEEAFRLVF